MRHKRSEHEVTPERPESEVTRVRFRVLILIFIMQLVFIGWVIDSEVDRGIYLICYSLMMPTALYLLIVRLLRRWLPFDDRELIFGYVILTATIPIVGFGGLRFIAEGMGYIPFFSRVQPNWMKFMGDISRLPVLQDADAVERLYKGGGGIPWRSWAVPILFWSTYLFLLSGIWMGLAGLLRRAWIHQERLSFPITVLPLQVIDSREDIFRRHVFWIGFAIPALLQSLLAIHDWIPSVPAFQLKARNIAPLIFTARPWSALKDLQIGYYPMAFGLAYFIPSNVSLSCWLFALLAKFSYVMGAVFGLDEAGVGIVRFPYKEEQAAGSWIAFAAIIIWSAIRQWRTVGKSVTWSERKLVRRMAIMAAACGLVCAGMMSVTGIPMPIALGVIAIYVAYVLSGARIRAEAGGIWTFAPLRTPHDIMYSMLGSQGASSTALVSGGHFHLIHVDIRAQSLPYLMEGMAIAEKSGIRWRTILIWVGICTVSALAIGWFCTLSKLYEIGAATAKANPYPINKAQISFNEVERLSGGVAPNRAGVTAMIFAGALTVLLTWANRTGKVGLHPVGYVLANTHTINSFILPFFAAWLAKSLVLRFGGGRSYRRSIPFFAGVVLGDIIAQAGWAVIGWIFRVPIYQFLT